MTSIIKVDQIQNAAGGVPTAADLGLNISGSVLQVVATEITTRNIATSSTSLVDVTGSALAITPKSTSSKILLTAHIAVYASVAAAPVWLAFYDTNNSTSYTISSIEAYNSSTYNGVLSSGAKLLSPNSTATQNYKMQFASYNARLIYVNARIGSTDEYNANSYLIAMEIAG